MSINYIEASVASKDPIIKGDLQTIFDREVSELSAFQKILLTANGTVTSMLEAYSSESIQVVKISEKLANIDRNFPSMKLNQEEQIMARKVLLQGKISCRNFIYADSVILINNLEEKFRHELFNTNKPIGQIWSEQKVETFKEIITYGKESANELAIYFNIKPEENVFFRTYSVSSQRKITMIITEKFPESYFHQKSN